MRTYQVTWMIDTIEAETPEQAAQLAYDMQRDPESTATFYDVVAVDAPLGTESETFEVTPAAWLLP